MRVHLSLTEECKKYFDDCHIHNLHWSRTQEDQDKRTYVILATLHRFSSLSNVVREGLRWTAGVGVAAEALKIGVQGSDDG